MINDRGYLAPMLHIDGEAWVRLLRGPGDGCHTQSQAKHARASFQEKAAVLILTGNFLIFKMLATD